MRRDGPAHLALVTVLASCGGNVVVDDAGAAPPESPCAMVCAKIVAACPSTPPDCVAMCAPIDQLAAHGACTDTMGTYLSCLSQDPSFACPPATDNCTMAETAFVDCAQEFCAASPASCE